MSVIHGGSLPDYLLTDIGKTPDGADVEKLRRGGPERTTGFLRG
jgi:hypothetical protein